MKKKQIYLMAAISALLVTLLIGSGSLLRMDKWTQDALYQRTHFTSTDIVIIGIDEKALQEIGPWPWSRDVMADAL